MPADSLKLFMSWVTQEWQSRRCKIFDHWAITVYGTSFQKFNLTLHFVTPLDKSTLSPYNPAYIAMYGLGSFLFARRYSENKYFSLFLQVLKCFTSLGLLHHIWCVMVHAVYACGFPHSETSGSKVVRHLPETYRRHATSFIAFFSLGIRHILLYFLLGNMKTIFIFSSPEKNFRYY